MKKLRIALLKDDHTWEESSIKIEPSYFGYSHDRIQRTHHIQYPELYTPSCDFKPPYIGISWIQKSKHS